jgi:uncharacterized protein with von Willebrand factor type A (vWA) domain
MKTHSIEKTFEVDLAALAAAFGQRLHEADMEVTPDQSERYVCSLALARPRSREALYHTTRAVFVSDVEQVATFDRVFADVFGASGTPDATSMGDIEPARAPAQA